MPLETATYISDLNTSNPAAGDTLAQADDHIRLIKAVIKATFPSITGPVTLTQAQINALPGQIGGVASIPIGTVVPYAGSTAPGDWLLCFGQEVSRTTYASLFSLIGTTYGSGNGTTTFNVPDLRGRVPAGKDDMGGTSAARLSVVLSSTTLGATGGSKNLQAHTHTGSVSSHSHSFSGSATTDSQGAHTHSFSGSTSTDGAHTHDLPGNVVSSGPGFSGGGSFGYSGASTLSSGSHSHTFSGTTGSSGAHTHSVSISGTTGSASPSVSVNSTGSGNAENVQPTIILNYIIHAGA